MEDKIKDAFRSLQTPERMKRTAKAQIRKKTFDYGRNVLQLRSHHRRLATGLLSLILVLSGCGLWFLPSASIAVDINPSIELKVNALDRVICLEGRNSDGMELIKDIDVAGMTYDDAMQRILLSNGLEKYLEDGSQITITVAGGGTNEHAEKMLSKVLCRAYHIADRDNVLYCQVDWETLKAAREVNLCIPRYLAWQNLLKSDPTITPEDVREIPKETIRTLAQVIIIEDPCH
jgi:hypothetical protein